MHRKICMFHMLNTMPYMTHKLTIHTMDISIRYMIKKPKKTDIGRWEFIQFHFKITRQN